MIENVSKTEFFCYIGNFKTLAKPSKDGRKVEYMTQNGKLLIGYMYHADVTTDTPAKYFIV